MSNPEFKRNLWLQFSWHRLIAMPVVLGLTFLTIVSGGSIHYLNSYLSTFFVGIVWVWGTRNASASITDELRDKTWDQQRMSALQPWTMTWGKLFGATSFNWYGGVICLLVAVISARNIGMEISRILTLIAGAILIHATTLALNLHTSQISSRIAHRGSLIGFLMMIGVIFSPWLSTVKERSLQWWGVNFDYHNFVLGSSLVFALCAVFAAWRVMSNALQVRTTPWAWPGFAILLSAFLAGFIPYANLNILLMTGLIVAITMTYIALFSEPNGISVWHRVSVRASTGAWRGAFEYLPLWPTTLLLSFVLAVLLSFAGSANLSSNSPGIAQFLNASPLAMAFMALRDTCIFLYFSFSEKANRVEATTLFYLVVLNVLLPFFAKVMGLGTLALVFMPINPAQPFWSPVIMGIHAAIALWWVIRRWHKYTERLHQEAQ